MSIQIISKESGKYKLIKTIGSGETPQEIAFLKHRAQQEIRKREGTLSLFASEKDALAESYLSQLSNGQIQVIPVLEKFSARFGLSFLGKEPFPALCKYYMR